MARFDVHQLLDGSGFVMNCQSDFLRHLDTRFVVPLVPTSIAPSPLVDRLNPIFDMDGKFAMMTQFAGAMAKSELGPPMLSLVAYEFEISAALDTLLTGV
jgi:toxin CcdB